ncbi:Calcineurin-like phosphoesterase [Friedmanniella luteola]|uniref:Calcineurin-like phosphoesterase n=1 Tax=Friedmanniella luteola TaxID=546871 RepID=A0A1H1S5Y9_9ACTN|nr:PKD domain-containing protein [Friedmanniella luteola]SDS43391.1 Calcineurin-like phosphoesterase [Friedmanniella luteola]
MRRRVTLRALVLAVFLVLLGTQVSAAPQPGRLHFTAAGDFAQTANTGLVLEKLAATGSDAAVTLGDMSYGAVGGEQGWCDFVKARVGASFPFEMLSGNHESNGLNGNINDFSACLPNQLPGAVGTYGRQYYVDVPADNPLVRFVMISPGLTYPDGTWSYAAGSARYQWTAQAIDGARAAGVPWVVVGMHKPCLTVGKYGCDSGADVFNLLLSKKVDLILSGHEHTYQRSHQLALGAGCPAFTPARYDAACVADTDSSFTAGAGSVAMVVGTGGQLLYDVTSTDPELPYMAATSGLNVNPTYGFLDVQATADVLQASFVRGAGGTLADSFTVTKGAAPADLPPVASFTSSCAGLVCSVDAGASTDPDGTIASYAWTFGDGTTATGVRVSHPYAAAGSYPVTLTVTDDDGGTAQSTRNVAPTAPAAGALVDDQFSRTTAGGWGSAPTGGAWTVSGSAANYAVGAGLGTVKVAAGSGPLATLNGVSTAGSDLRLSAGLDKLPAGSGLYLATHARRVTGAGAYLAKTRVTSTGSVTLELTRTTATGTETNLQPAVVVTGLTYAPGDLLNIRTQAAGSAPTTVRAKVWKVGSPEPTTWQRSVTDTTAGLQTAGSVGVSPYLSSGATNAPVTVRLDSLVVTAP